MTNTTRQGIEYWEENGLYTIDGYDFFETMEELETDLDWQGLWIDGKAHRENGEWVLDNEHPGAETVQEWDAAFSNLEHESNDDYTVTVVRTSNGFETLLFYGDEFTEVLKIDKRVEEAYAYAWSYLNRYVSTGFFKI